MYTCKCRCPRTSDEGLRSPGAGVTASCEWPEIGAGNQMQVFCITAHLQCRATSLPLFCKDFNEYLLNCCMGIFEILSIGLPALAGWPWRGHTTPVSIFTHRLWNRKRDKTCDARAVNYRTADAVGCSRYCGSLFEAVGLYRIHSAFLWAVLIGLTNEWILSNSFKNWLSGKHYLFIVRCVWLTVPDLFKLSPL